MAKTTRVLLIPQCSLFFFVHISEVAVIGSNLAEISDRAKKLQRFIPSIEIDGKRTFIQYTKKKCGSTKY